MLEPLSVKKEDFFFHLICGLSTFNKKKSANQVAGKKTVPIKITLLIGRLFDVILFGWWFKHANKIMSANQIAGKNSANKNNTFRPNPTVVLLIGQLIEMVSLIFSRAVRV